MMAFQQEAQSSLLLFVLSSPTGRHRRSTSLTPASLSSSLSSSSKLSRVDDEHKNTIGF
jgi:hypothetical protein